MSINIIDCSGNAKWNTNFYNRKRLFPNGAKFYPTNHNGRWNWGLSNTKLFPINSYEYDANGNIIKIKQAKNVFNNTSYIMNKHELYNYLSKNRAYLYR